MPEKPVNTALCRIYPIGKGRILRHLVFIWCFNLRNAIQRNATANNEPRPMKWVLLTSSAGLNLCITHIRSSACRLAILCPSSRIPLVIHAQMSDIYSTAKRGNKTQEGKDYVTTFQRNRRVAQSPCSSNQRDNRQLQPTWQQLPYRNKVYATYL